MNFWKEKKRNKKKSANLIIPEYPVSSFNSRRAASSADSPFKEKRERRRRRRKERERKEGNCQPEGKIERRRRKMEEKKNLVNQTSRKFNSVFLNRRAKLSAKEGRKGFVFSPEEWPKEKSIEGKKEGREERRGRE